MRFYELRDRVVHRIPIFMGGQRAEVGSGRLNLKIHRADLVIGARDPYRTRTPGAVASHLEPGEKLGQRFDRAQGCRETDPRRPHPAPRAHHPLEALQGDRQMGPALIARQRMKFINHHVANRGELLAEFRGSEQQKERFGRGNQNVWRPTQHRAALMRGGVTSAQTRADAAQVESCGMSRFADAREWLLEV